MTESDPAMTQGEPPDGGVQDGTPTGGVQLSQGPLKGELAAVLVLTTHGVGIFGMMTVSAPERIVACRQALFASASVGCQQLALATVLCRRECASSLLTTGVLCRAAHATVAFQPGESGAPGQGLMPHLSALAYP